MLNLPKILAIGLLVLGLILGVMAWMTSSKARQTSAVSSPSVALTPDTSPDVVVLSRDVPAGQALSLQDLRTQTPGSQITGHIFRQPDTLLGQVLVTALPEGTALRPEHLVMGISTLLQPGERALSILVEEGSAAAHRIQPGDWVDVFFVLRRDDREIVSTQARLLLARKRVLAYGLESIETAAHTVNSIHQETQAHLAAQKESNADKNANAPARPVPRTAVLALKAEDVLRVALAEQQGVLRLALRHPSDTSEPNPELLAALPTALAVQTEHSSNTLTGLDAAQAGLALSSLAQGAPISSTAPALSPLAKAVRSVPRTSPARTRTESVEIIRGPRREEVRY